MPTQPSTNRRNNGTGSVLNPVFSFAYRQLFRGNHLGRPTWPLHVLTGVEHVPSTGRKCTHVVQVFHPNPPPQLPSRLENIEPCARANTNTGPVNSSADRIAMDTLLNPRPASDSLTKVNGRSMKPLMME
ncbi:hypothetical protein ZHAS_00019876 [Anopheles sinensis]|uniref:Uncharacterized protein n=1 Tax=Anopheles sinensis TaxID=74873 RepID=A0A084WMF7_ANOSI|nr:hypothetical protein ZHAS_00019876 [Anopheles sinensis]